MKKSKLLIALPILFVTLSMMTANADEKYTKQTNYEIQVQDKTIKKDVYKSNNQLMLPLRTIAQEMGYDVSYDTKTKSVTVKGNQINTTIKIGSTKYEISTTKTIENQLPLKLDIAPILIDNTTYVSKDFFDILQNKVNINENKITVDIADKKEIVQKDMQTQIPNPIKEYESLDEAVSNLDFKPPIINLVDYDISSVFIISNYLLEIDFTKGDQKIDYRVAKYDENQADISGDYNIYTNIREIQKNGKTIKLKGNDDKISLMTYSDKYLSFSVSFKQPVSEEVATSLII